MPNVFEDMEGGVPLAWVRAQRGPPPYVNVGDALSPFLVSMVSGRPVAAAEFASASRRLAAIGTIGQNFRDGEVEIWGTGCSPWRDPLSSARTPYTPPASVRVRIHAARGPLSAKLLSGGQAPDVPFGDPAALLPRFHPPSVAKRWELGAVLHLSELADRGFDAKPKPEILRYTPPGDGSVRLITMVAPPTVDGVRGKIDEILACKRIVSTSLHGYAIAAAYGIPCLYIGSDRGADGLARAALGDVDTLERVNARFVDLLLGYGETDIVYWRQRKRREPDWDGVIRAIDAEAPPLSLDADALIAACPAGAAPLSAPPGETIWDHPIIATAPFNAANPPVFSARRPLARKRRWLGFRSGRAGR